MWITGLVAALVVQAQAAEAPDDRWRWIASDADVVVGADGHSIVATGENRTFNLVTVHRAALADGSDILHWQVERNCGDGSGRARLTARDRTLGQPAPGEQLPGEWEGVSDVIGAAATYLCEGRLDPYRRGRNVGGGHGIDSVQGFAQLVRGHFWRTGPRGDWRSIGGTESAFLAKDGSNEQHWGYYKVRRLALTTTRTPEPGLIQATALVDCSHGSVILVDGHQPNAAGRRPAGVSVASGYHQLEAATFRRNDVEAEIAVTMFELECNGGEPAGEPSFDNALDFARMAQAYLNR